MTRPSLLDFCGAGARLAPERGTALPPNLWAWQAKIDGVYARVTLDAVDRHLARPRLQPFGGLYTVVDIGTDAEAFVP